MIDLIAAIQILFLAVTGSASNATVPTRCVPAYPEVPSNITTKHCLQYQYPINGYCRNVVHWPVYGTKEHQKAKEDGLIRFNVARRAVENLYKLRVRNSCLETFNQTYCRLDFPKCDATTQVVQGKPVCKETCEYLQKMCKKEFAMVDIINGKIVGTDFPIHWKVIDCSSFLPRNGGDSPECYYIGQLNNETDKLKSIDCYYANGLGYHGNVSVTRSGHVCQSWSSQCPHRHNHPLAEYPELINASNWCRNPGGQAPNGPWCYTTSTSTRWEYCDVRKCPATGPTLSPEVVQAFSTGSHKISIEWRPVPLPFVHGTPRGFRIQIRKLGGKDFMINTTSSDTKYFEIENLQPLTDYSLSVLEFNEHRDGPWSRPVLVQTMPQNFVAITFTLILKGKKFSSDLLERDTIKYKALESDFKSKLNKVFASTRSKNYKIYQIKINKFFNNGSVGVEFHITAELMTATSAWLATQSITGRILKQTKTKTSMQELIFSSLLVQAPPPPPVNLSQSDVSMTSVTVHWSAPVHNEPFRLTNYTVQYKKSGTKMSYYNAMIVSSDKRESVVKNLDSNTKYLMRVVSMNAYGSQPSEHMVVQTKGQIINHTPSSILSIVIPPAVMAVILIGVGFLFWRWWHKKREEERKLKVKIERLRENPYESEVNWFKLLRIEVVKQFWEITRDDLKLEHELGSGQFGVVNKALLKTKEEGKEHLQHCAVKMMKENPTERELRDFCNEINIMSSIGDHPNIVSLIGACTVNGPPLLVVKFAPNGCLLDYIKENRPLPEYQNTGLQEPELMPKVITEKERLNFAYEVAQGMSHLERHRYVHRDLAARNVLLGKNMVAMVSDFGLSRDLYEMGVYENTTGGILPVRWMAIESLQDYTYTTETDVWSYGVLLWEIENGGVVPYGGLSGLEILEKLRQGYRLEKPRDTSRDLYSIMWKCWNPDPKQRPTFSDLVYQFGGLLSLVGGYEEILSSSQIYDSVVIKEDEMKDDPVLRIRDNNVIELNNITNEMRGRENENMEA